MICLKCLHFSKYLNSHLLLFTFVLIQICIFFAIFEWIIDVDLLEADCHLFKNFFFFLIHTFFFCKVLVVFFSFSPICLCIALNCKF